MIEISALPSIPLQASDEHALNKLRLDAASQGTTEIDKVSKDFEAVFIAQMMSEMFSGEELTEYFGGGTAGDIYKSLMMNEYGKAIANSGGIGIAKQIKEELLKLQEIDHAKG